MRPPKAAVVLAGIQSIDRGPNRWSVASGRRTRHSIAADGKEGGHVGQETKARATREGRTVGELIEDALRAYRRRVEDDAPIERLPVYGGSGVTPGVDLSDASSLRNLMYEDAPVTTMR